MAGREREREGRGVGGGVCRRKGAGVRVRETVEGREGEGGGSRGGTARKREGGEGWRERERRGERKEKGRGGRREKRQKRKRENYGNAIIHVFLNANIITLTNKNNLKYKKAHDTIHTRSKRGGRRERESGEGGGREMV